MTDEDDPLFPSDPNHYADDAYVDLALTLADEAATERLGRALARILRPGEAVAVMGPLGAGKSVLARAFVRERTGDDDEEVPSPTFTLVQTYDDDGTHADLGEPPPTIWHFDLYRLESPEEVLELDIEDAFASGVSVVEWAERLGPYLPWQRLEVHLSVNPDETRRAEIGAFGEWDGRLDEIAPHVGH